VRFSYKALTADGKVVEDATEAKDRYEFLKQAKADGLTLMHISSFDEMGVVKLESEGGIRSRLFGINKKAIAFFTRQLAELTLTGIPLMEALSAVRKVNKSSQFQEILSIVEQDIEKGLSFSDALARHPIAFSDLYVAMIRTGELSGRLTEVLLGLAEYLERELDIQAKVRSALSYPLITLSLSVILCYCLVAFLLPRFQGIWTGAHLSLEDYPITEFLVTLSKISHNIVDEIVVALLLAGIYFLYKRLLATPGGTLAKDSLILKIPGVGSFAQTAVVARVANTIGTLMKSGVTSIKAITIAAETAGNERIAVALKEVANELASGGEMAYAFEKSQVFPDIMVQMVGIGERSGSLADIMPRMAEYYNRQLDDAVKVLTSVIEPLTMVAVGGIVFVFVLGIFMPIMGIVSALQSQM